MSSMKMTTSLGPVTLKKGLFDWIGHLADAKFFSTLKDS
jgi:hypothetical protein